MEVRTTLGSMMFSSFFSIFLFSSCSFVEMNLTESVVSSGDRLNTTIVKSNSVPTINSWMSPVSEVAFEIYSSAILDRMGRAGTWRTLTGPLCFASLEKEVKFRKLSELSAASTWFSPVNFPLSKCMPLVFYATQCRFLMIECSSL